MPTDDEVPPSSEVWPAGDRQAQQAPLRRRLFSALGGLLGAEKPPRVVGDMASVLGIPAHLLTPPVEEAIVKLMGEVERLRIELETERHREAWLEDQADRHPTLPVLNRRGLMRELGRQISRCEQAHVPACLLAIHVGGVERVKIREGLAASDLVLRQIALAIADNLRRTDVVAHIDGGDFAVIMTLSGGEAASTKAAQLAVVVGAQVFDCDSRRYTFTATVGTHHLRVQEPPEAAMDAADLARRARLEDD